MLRIPSLRIGWIGNHGIQIERIVSLGSIVVHRPVLLEGIAAASHNIIRFDTTHNEIHTGQVVGVFLQLLRVIHDIIFTSHIL